MRALLDTIRDLPCRAFASGETVLAQGESTGLLFVLIEGAAEITKD